MQIDTKAFARFAGMVMMGILALAALIGGTLQAQAGAPAAVPAQQDTTGKIDKQVLKDTANGQTTSFIIMLAEQADVSAAYNMKDQDARGWYVYNTLRDYANKTQAPIRAILASAGAQYEAFWVANMIEATGDSTLVRTLAARSDVKSIDSNNPVKWTEDNQPVDTSNIVPNTTEWGVNNVNAPAVWAMGYTGQGIVVGNQDTGMRWTHNAIKPKYRGWNGTTADHNYNWWDAIHSQIAPGANPCGYNSVVPCDDQGHGTHTTGTTVGDDGAGNQIGVAPGATWIGCHNMDSNVGRPTTYSECFQFFIAPTDLNGQNANPALRPHVMNNSWGCPTSELCTTRAELETVVNNSQAAGIFVEASAGNAGSGCSSVTDPPAIYGASFSTGAIDINNNLAGFSSRGPSTFYTPNMLKPEISAPGVNVRSSYWSNDSSYANLQGTSMAGPHVVGVVALLWSARPSISRDITTTKTILENTANPNVVVAAQTCGGIPSSQIPNNSFGYGRVDALAAVNSVQQGTPTPTPSGPQPTATRTNTPTAGCTPQAAGWSAGPALPNPPATLVRAVGVYFPANGKFYSVGGRTSDAAGSDYQRVLEYTPGNPGTWVQKAATLPDNNMNNMACGVLTVSGTAKIYCVGGSFATGTTATGRVFSYDPVADTAATLTGDDWPGNAGGTVLPGGFAVVANKLYIIGGFTVPMGPMIAQTWQFDATAAVGAKWTQKLDYPQQRGYVPAAAVGNIIYTAGGSLWDGTTLQDSADSYKYDTVANTWTAITNIPRATGETRAVVQGGNIWVLGGGRTAPNPSNEVDVYNIAGNSWTVGTPFTNARRNFPADSDGTTVWLAGGYEPTTAAGDMEIYRSGTSCGTGTPTAPPVNTNTPTRTNTPVSTVPGNTNTPTRTNTPPPGGGTDTPTPSTPLPTSTVCSITFTDVQPGSTFYEFIRCLACRGIINGYPDGTFRPNNNATRGQISKIVSNSAGFSDPQTTQMFQDVPVGSTFFEYIGRLASRGYISGYACGGAGEPCVPPDNLPYFRPNANATRGQVSKIVSNAAGFTEPHTGQTFQDVAPGSTFYDFIERLASRGVMSGYACGSVPSEPCVPPENRPYFRPNNNITRGQLSKIVANTFFPGCQTPGRR